MVSDEKVCPDAGIILHAKEGDFVKKGQTVMEVFGKDSECFSQALPLLTDALSYSDTEIRRERLIVKAIR